MTFINPSLQRVTVSLPNCLEGEFWISDVAEVQNEKQRWCFTLHGTDKGFIARFKYHDETAAKRAALALGASLQGAVCVELKE